MGLSRGTTCLELESTKGIRGTIGRSGRATTISGSVSTSRGYGNMVDRVTRIRVHRVVGRIIGGGVTTQWTRVSSSLATIILSVVGAPTSRDINFFLIPRTRPVSHHDRSEIPQEIVTVGDGVRGSPRFRATQPYLVWGNKEIVDGNRVGGQLHDGSILIFREGKGAETAKIPWSSSVVPVFGEIEITKGH